MKKRVRIPNNPGLIIALAKQVKDKHTNDGDASVLLKMKWNILGSEIDEAVALQEQTMQLKRELLELFEKRESKIKTMSKFLRNSRDILTGLHSDEMKILGQWGFDVMDNRSSKVGDAPPSDIAEHSG